VIEGRSPAEIAALETLSSSDTSEFKKVDMGEFGVAVSQIVVKKLAVKTSKPISQSFPVIGNLSDAESIQRSVVGGPLLLDIPRGSKTRN
jgi:hypothetical protein